MWLKRIQKNKYFFVLFLAACTSQNLSKTLVSFNELPGWEEDTTHKALKTIQLSCAALLKQGSHSSWHPFCKEAQKLPKIITEKECKRFLMAHLQAYKLSWKKCEKAKVTGYYEPLLKGNTKPCKIYNTPLYKLPDNKDSFIINKPRADIVSGALKNKSLELFWVDDPITAFFLQIQGSGRIQLPNGKKILLGFAGTNKHPYVPIGRTLIVINALKKEEVSMQSIYRWLKENPLKAEDIMSTNPSYVFFTILNTENPLGTQGVPLTPERSAAVDPLYISMGTPLWFDIKHPTNPTERIRKLVVAQDTGGAIKGPLRFDYFWGAGEEAFKNAGVMNHEGVVYGLYPRPNR